MPKVLVPWNDDETVQIDFTDEEWRMLKRAAKRARKSLEDYMTSVLRGALEDRKRIN